MRERSLPAVQQRRGVPVLRQPLPLESCLPELRAELSSEHSGIFRTVLELFLQLFVLRVSFFVCCLQPEHEPVQGAMLLHVSDWDLRLWRQMCGVRDGLLPAMLKLKFLHSLLPKFRSLFGK
jgi:hypothetical protein